MNIHKDILVLTSVILGLLVSSSSQQILQENAIQPSPIPPLLVLADRPFSLAKSVAKVPLVTIPQKELVIVRKNQITAMSPIQPLVTCATKDYGLTEAMPAVRMLLKKPMQLLPTKAFVDFPSSVSVIHRGVQVPIPVGALIAPVLDYQSQPVLIRVMYAVPTFPEHYQLSLPPPIYVASTYGRPTNFQVPLFHQNYASARPLMGYQPASATSMSVEPPKETAVVGEPESKPPSSQQAQPVVTILDFPEAVASPSVLYYQPPLGTDSEFENREPPQPVIPAGIIQSTAPQPNVQLFTNSKESIYLASIKEDLKKS